MALCATLNQVTSFCARKKLVLVTVSAAKWKILSSEFLLLMPSLRLKRLLTVPVFNGQNDN